VPAPVRDERLCFGFVEDPTEGWMVIASAVGAARHPEWLYNLARQPDVTIEFEDGRRIPVHAETLEGDELVAAWDQIGLDAPEYLGYRSKTDREIAVIRLRRRAT
jgi:F420H(2)-dependent quinone reductase